MRPLKTPLPMLPRCGHLALPPHLCLASEPRKTEEIRENPLGAIAGKGPASTSHAPCCVHERTVLGNDALFGNRYNGVARMQDCCNLCTNHPLCSSWEYDSRRRCVLKRGEPKLVPASSEAFLEGLTTWAGLSSGAHSATACPLDTASADAAMRTTATTELANRLVV